LTPAQAKAARVLLGWSQTDLAKASGLGLSTVYDFENGRREVAAESVAKIRKALEKAGVEFTNGKRPGVRMTI
jgi:transcriptional regulator with XRE-family HTH domain